MLTRLRVANVKRLEACEIELGDVVVFVGPNLLLPEVPLDVGAGSRRHERCDRLQGPAVTKIYG